MVRQHLMDLMKKWKQASVYAGMHEGHGRMLPNHQAWSEAVLVPDKLIHFNGM